MNKKSFKMFGWVPDGIYDHREFLVRYVIENGNPLHVITKTWVDDGGLADIEPHLKIKWGSHPDIPPKPAK